MIARTHARTLIISDDYYRVLRDVAQLVCVDIEDRVEYKSLDEISNGKLSYGSGAKAIEYDGKIRYIRITDIDEKGQLKEEKVSPDTVEDKYTLEKGDILFARSGATVGKTYYYNLMDKAIYAGYLIKLSVDSSQALSRYVYYCVNTSNYEKFVLQSKSNASQPNINAQQYANFGIPLPPLHVQQRIVSILDTFNTLVHDMQEGLPKEIKLRQQQYEYYRERLLSFPKASQG